MKKPFFVITTLIIFLLFSACGEISNIPDEDIIPPADMQITESSPTLQAAENPAALQQDGTDAEVNEALYANFNLRGDIDNELESIILPDTYLAYKVAIKTLDSINRRNYESLSKHIHPEKGIVFTPFSFVDYDENHVFSSDQVSKFGDDNNEYIWGIAVSNLPMKFTVNEYFEQFVCDKNYINVDQIAINSIVKQGNSIENVAEIFDDAIFIDFHDSGSKEYEGLDWSSLKIVMGKYNGEFKITAIIHSCYTL